MPGVRDGWMHKNSAVRKERLRNVLRKDPHCETKVLAGRFSFCKETVQLIKNEVHKELGIQRQRSQFISVDEARMAMHQAGVPTARHPWREYPRTCKLR